ncbi:MAG: hypothetical protein ACYSW3_25820 [Planctomycetota bacterium]|jgi:hypothetical protein
MATEDSTSSLELMLKHYIDSINKRLDKLTDSLDDLKMHKSLLVQLEKRMDVTEERYIDLNQKIQKLLFEQDRRDDISKSITNPIIQRTIWVLICGFCIGGGMFWKSIDNQSTKDLVKLMNQKH